MVNNRNQFAAALARRREKEKERGRKAAEYEKWKESQATEEDLRWGDEVSQGMAIGGSILPGWGHAIGGIAGGLYGMGKAVSARKKQGQGWGGAVRDTVIGYDKNGVPLMGSLPSMSTAASVAPSLAGSFGRMGGKAPVGAAAGGVAGAMSTFQPPPAPAALTESEGLQMGGYAGNAPTPETDELAAAIAERTAEEGEDVRDPLGLPPAPAAAAAEKAKRKRERFEGF